MLSKARIKYIKSLQVKKYRQLEQRFVVEGAKTVLELLASDYATECVLSTPDFLAEYEPELKRFAGELIEVKPDMLATFGEYHTNNGALAIARIKPNMPPQLTPHDYALVLDDIRDPGNLGTIIRIADWYGIKAVIASAETAELYNPKVLHASKGSFTRVPVFYTELTGFLADVTVPVYGTFLAGDDVHTVPFGKGGMIVIGNEAHGISAEVEKFVTKKISIPRYGKAESLNAGVATAVICDNIRRNIFNHGEHGGIHRG
ncbi:MAG: RNA methyltransferase [Cyclobacteriaceae bacterium]|nr:RNA methyltransferase [Cyclobacteriaceae bacterium]